MDFFGESPLVGVPRQTPQPTAHKKISAVFSLFALFVNNYDI